MVCACKHVDACSVYTVPPYESFEYSKEEQRRLNSARAQFSVLKEMLLPKEEPKVGEMVVHKMLGT